MDPGYGHKPGVEGPVENRTCQEDESLHVAVDECDVHQDHEGHNANVMHSWIWVEDKFDERDDKESEHVSALSPSLGFLGAHQIFSCISSTV